MPVRLLPNRPDLNQLKHQARELLRAFRARDASAIADFNEFGVDPTLPDHGGNVGADTKGLSDAKLHHAQLVLARSYGVSSWPRLVAVCELIDALLRDDIDETIRLLDVHRDTIADFATVASSRGADASVDPAGWRPAMSHAANRGLRRIISTLQMQGARDIEIAMNNPEHRVLVDTVRALSRLGAMFPSDAVGGSVEILSGSNFAFMVESGTKIEDERGDWRSRVALALETYARNPAGKHRILDVMASRGIPFPDTAPMSLHRGRMDLLEECLRRDPRMLQRTYSHHDFFPPTLGCHSDEALALVGAPLGGATLLHMAADYEEVEIVRWLLDKGMDVNIRADVDATGIGSHTAIFNRVISYNARVSDDPTARLLLARGADPNVRASLRKRLAFAQDKSTHEYRDVTPAGWAAAFHDQSYVCRAAVNLVVDHGGVI